LGHGQRWASYSELRPIFKREQCTALQQAMHTHVRFGSKADIDTRQSNVSFTPETDIRERDYQSAKCLTVKNCDHGQR
jgi:hypothetical protein